MKFVLPVSERHGGGGDRIDIHVIGVGGTGSSFLAALVKLAKITSAVGLPPLHVTVWDDDTVSPSNIGRQVFAPADIGRKKAAVLVNRINLTYGLNWKAVTTRFEGMTSYRQVYVVGCVDTRKARAHINRFFSTTRSAVWIDCGNDQVSGQVVMGVRHEGNTLVPSAADLFPEMVNVQDDAKDDAPSCSVAEAIARQDPMINQMVADFAANLLWRLVRFGEVQAHGAFLDAESFSAMPIPVDPGYWASLGWNSKPHLAVAA